MHKISVIIPLYNKEKNCAAAIESVLNQSFPYLELIIIDDGSTDNSANIAKEVIRSDNRARIFTQLNQGVSIARNNGALKANYDYLAFLDADDLWHPRYLDVLAEAITKYPYESWFGVSYKRFIGEIQFQEVKGPLNFIKTNFFKGTIDSNYKKPGYISLVNSDSFIIKRSLFDSVNGYEQGMSYAEDLHFYCKVALLSDLVWAKEELTYYRVDAENQVVMAMIPRELPEFIKEKLTKKTCKNEAYIFDFFVFQAMTWVWSTVGRGVFHQKLKSYPLKYMLLSLQSSKYRYKILCKYLPVSLVFLFNSTLAKKILNRSINGNVDENISASKGFNLTNNED